MLVDFVISSDNEILFEFPVERMRIDLQSPDQKLRCKAVSVQYY